MLAVFPFFNGDLSLLRQNLVWIKELGEVKTHDALLVADADTQWSDCVDLVKIASDAFRTVKLITNDHPVAGWIPGAVSLFRTAAMWCEENKRDFWWHEADCVPLVPSWLNDIEKEYNECGKLFLGAIVKAEDPKYPPFFLEGCSVYVWNAWSLMKNCIKDTEAWVTSCAEIVVPNAHNSKKVQQIWGQPGMPVRFVPFRTSDSPAHDWTLDNLRKGAVIFHREKSGELIELLWDKMFPNRLDYRNPPAFVQMGRVGDLILMLPAWRAWAQRSGRPTVVVTSREFGQVLEGASYVQPVMLNYSWYDAGKAQMWAMGKYPRVIVTQLHGTGIQTVPDDLPSYSLSMWKKTGLMDEYHDLPLVFDQRNPNREKNLIARTLTSPKPVILMKFDAWTSPFDESNHVKVCMREMLSDRFQLVDLDKVVADRVYDLLGLFDMAVGLVTVDTMALHLAAASKVEYVAFTRDDGQSGSIPKGNVVLQIGYRQWNEQRYAFELQMKLWLAKSHHKIKEAS
jgi:hypothetical protein